MKRVGLWFLYEPMGFPPDEVENAIVGLLVLMHDQGCIELNTEETFPIHINTSEVEQNGKDHCRN